VTYTRGEFNIFAIYFTIFTTVEKLKPKSFAVNGFQKYRNGAEASDEVHHSLNGEHILYDGIQLS
jgi:hypothetical protein